MKYTKIKYEKTERTKLFKKDDLIKIYCILKKIEFNGLYLVGKIIIIIIIFIISNYLKFYLKNKSKSHLLSYKKSKVCLCTLGKGENNYAREFVEHYKKYGIDKIFIYDNNDLEGEKFETVLSDYIRNKYVKIKNYRGKQTIQIKILNDCYKNNYKKFDWFLMFDMDEFIFLKKFKNIKSFLNDKRFKKCELIYLNRLFHTDNNQLYYKNISLFQRFPKYKYTITRVKSIIRGHLFNLKIKSQHIINYNFKGCDGFGHIFNRTRKIPDFKYYYLNHFYFKSTEEFINKVNRGDCYFVLSEKLKFNKIKFYFSINEITLEKIKILENKTGLYLKEFRKRLKRLNKTLKFKI